MKLPIEASKDSSHTSDNDSDFDGIKHDGPTNKGMKAQIKCEVKEYEERANLKGEVILKEVEAKVAADEKDESTVYAMTSYKEYTREGSLSSSRLEISSPYIQDALRAVVKKYPGVSFGGDMVILSGKLRCVFHYRKELEEYRLKIEDRIAKLHVHLLLRFMEKEMRGSIRGYKANVETTTAAPSIEYKDLWMVFLPGESIVTGLDEMNQMLSLVASDLVETSGGGRIWRITGRCLTHDGAYFGYSNKYITISPYEGTKTVRSFPVLPLRYYDTEPELEQFRKFHIARGRKFCSLKGNHHRAYTGRAYTVGDELERDDCGNCRPPLPPNAPYYSYKLESITVRSAKCQKGTEY